MEWWVYCFYIAAVLIAALGLYEFIISRRDDD